MPHGRVHWHRIVLALLFPPISLHIRPTSAAVWNRNTPVRGELGSSPHPILSITPGISFLGHPSPVVFRLTSHLSPGRVQEHPPGRVAPAHDMGGCLRTRRLLPVHGLHNRGYNVPYNPYDAFRPLQYPGKIFVIRNNHA